MLLVWAWRTVRHIRHHLLGIVIDASQVLKPPRTLLTQPDRQKPMTLPIHTDSLESVPEPLREHYKKHGDGGFVLDAQSGGGFSVEKVAGLKSALSAARSEAKDATTKLAAFIGDDGDLLDASSARDAMGKLAALGNDADIESKVSAAVQAQVDAMSQKHGKELSVRDDRVTGLTKQISKHILDDALTSALIDTSDGRTQAINPKVLSASLRDRLKIQEAEGKWEVHVLDDQGNRRISPASDERRRASGRGPQRRSETVLPRIECCWHWWR